MSPRSTKALIATALFFLSCLLYWPVRNHPFINFDDPLYVTENAHVQGGLSSEGLSWAFGELHGRDTYWHPLTWVSHMLDCQLFGLNAGAHHLVNVTWHALNAGLLFLLLQGLTGAIWRSALVAFLFAVHPLQVDTVAWITERKNLLSTFFWIVTLWAYVRYARATQGKYWLYGLCLLSFAFGLMAKPAIVTLPCVLLLLDFWPLGRFRLPEKPLWSTTALREGVRSLAARIPEKLPFFFMALVSSAITVESHEELGVLVADALSPAQRIGNAFVSYGRYLAKLIWPSKLAVFYPHPGTWPVWQVTGAIVFFLGITLLALWSIRKRPYFFVGWFWFVGTLVPVIGLVQASGQSMADRFCYVPAIGFFIAIIWGVAEFLKDRSRLLFPATAFGVAIGIVLFICTRVQIGYWQDTYHLFDHAVKVTEKNYIAHNQLGSVFMDRKDYTNAAIHFAAALEGDPMNFDAFANGGNAYFLSGRLTEAENFFQRGLRLQPANLFVLSRLARVHLQQQKFEDAVAELSEAVRLAPSSADLHFYLSQALAAEGKIGDAVQHCQEALRLNSDHKGARFQLAVLLSSCGRDGDAIVHYEELLKADPDYLNALNNLAWIRATSPDEKLRSGSEAVRLAGRACELTANHKPVFLGTFAAALAEAGRYPEAIQKAEQARDLAIAEGSTNVARANQDLLELYRASKPARQR
jgi:tetratricopeptide (TPR) repeat protein